MNYKFLLPFFLISSIHGKGQIKPELTLDNARKKALLQNVYAVIGDNYVFPERGIEMIDNLRKNSSLKKYDAITTPHDFAAAITRDMKTTYNDKHLRIIYDPKLQRDIVNFLSSRKGADQINLEDSLNDVKQNFYFRKVEILPSNIGYIDFTGFAKPNISASKTVSAAMQFVSHTDALIIDLRNNFGGNGLMANEILSYFFKSKTFIGKSFNRIENTWIDEFVDSKVDITGGLTIKVPIYVLTSSRTYSAAEGFAYTLQNIKNAVIIGDTTRGGAHLTRSFSLGDGFVAFIPYMRTENVKTKTDWEGVGVIPQLTADERKALMTAQILALNEKLSRSSDEVEKRKITWLLKYYQSQDSPLSVNVSDYTEAVGRFAEFEISILDNQLVFRDTNQRTKDYKKLIAITADFFQVDRDYQVELVKGANGKYNSIKIFWDDGWMELIDRSN